jgi:hypothetical protein
MGSVHNQAFGILKKAAAEVNKEFGLDPKVPYSVCMYKMLVNVHTGVVSGKAINQPRLTS